MLQSVHHKSSTVVYTFFNFQAKGLASNDCSGKISLTGSAAAFEEEA